MVECRFHPEQDDLIDVAYTLADAARIVTLRHFRSSDLLADSKQSKGFDPVTIADRDCEAAMRAILADRRPHDAVLGEEMGAVTGTSGLTWVLDPVDGTRAYLAGAPTWGVLISVADEAGPIFGLIDQPHIAERFEGGFARARVVGPRGESILGTRAPRPLSGAILMTTFPEIGSPEEAAAFARVASQVRLVRYGMDCYAYALIAAGQIDLVIEAGLQPYDIHAPIAVIEAAGGLVTDWTGGPATGGGRILAAANASIHAEAMALLAG